MNKQLRYLQLAISYFTRLPIASIADFQEQDLTHAAKFLSLIGILVGAIAGLVYFLATLLLPNNLAIMLSMISSILVTGALHEDGLADSCDGLGGGWQPEQILAIMKDSRIGSYGVIALIIMLMLKFQSLSQMPEHWLIWSLIAGHSISRFSALWLMTTLNYARLNGKASNIASQQTPQQLLFALGCCLPVILFQPKAAVFALLPVVVVCWYFSNLLKKRLAGYTGDTLGAMQQLTETSFYLGVVAWNSI